LEINIEDSKEIYKSGYGGNYIGILPSNSESLRERIKEKLKLNTENQNIKLLEAEEEIKEIENLSFFTYRLINDNFKNSFQIFKNIIISIYPIIKSEYSKIEKIKELALKNGDQQLEDV
jgi:guanylate kinase